MKLLKLCVIAAILFSILVAMMIPLHESSTTGRFYDKPTQPLKDLNTATGESLTIINDIFDEKYDEISAQGYLSQPYESSLQATYYALYILNAIGALDQVNQAEVFNYIMAHYDEGSERFMDSYAERYLGTDFSYKNYYPLSTLLEVNCYAVLSLAILNELDKIDESILRDFIWSCYKTGGGFIGQPYTEDIHQYLQRPTADNTYYAILALEALNVDWSNHNGQKISTVNFLTGLMITDDTDLFFGGFLNDVNNSNFESIGFNVDPNLLSSYFCVKSLDLLGYVLSFSHEDFHLFFEQTYDDSVPYFTITFTYVLSTGNWTSLIATALGLQLSDLTSYSSVNWNGAVDFILDNQNSWGTWDACPELNYRELMDTFQIIRALSEVNELDRLTLSAKTQIANVIVQYYEQYDNGFSLLSRAHTSLQQLHSLVKSVFGIYGKNIEFGPLIDQFYDLVMSCYDLQPLIIGKEHIFTGCIDLIHPRTPNPAMYGFRSKPIEFFSNSYHPERNEIGIVASFRTIYYALDTIYWLGKSTQLKTDLGLEFLTELAGNIIDCQFLNDSHPNNGGFLPRFWFKDIIKSDEEQNSYIFLEYAYYTIKTLEILVLPQFLDKGDVTDFAFDKNELVAYLIRGQKGVGSTLYYDPWYSDDLDTVLRNTYYMVYIMNKIAPANLDSLKIAKIQNFVLQSINYSSIKNIYYSYKLSEILNLSIEFDFSRTNQLVKDLYSNEYGGFYLTSNKQFISDEVFLWSCDMAKNDDMQATVFCPEPVELGTMSKKEVNITVFLNNIILDYFGSDIAVQFISGDGTFNLYWKPTEGYYQEEVVIYNKIENYPLLYAEIEVTKGDKTIVFELVIQTTSHLFESKSSSETQDDIDGNSEEGYIIEPSITTALPVMITLIAVPSIVIIISGRSKRKSGGIPIHN